MTKDTRNEVESFYSLFGDIVDDVTITQYNERGGNISDLDKQTKDKIMNYLKKIIFRKKHLIWLILIIIYLYH